MVLDHSSIGTQVHIDRRNTTKDYSVVGVVVDRNPKHFFFQVEREAETLFLHRTMFLSQVFFKAR